jgi:hypothetical protein
MIEEESDDLIQSNEQPASKRQRTVLNLNVLKNRLNNNNNDDNNNDNNTNSDTDIPMIVIGNESNEKFSDNNSENDDN